MSLVQVFIPRFLISRWFVCSVSIHEKAFSTYINIETHIRIQSPQRLISLGVLASVLNVIACNLEERINTRSVNLQYKPNNGL
jgi:hypothetical protein